MHLFIITAFTRLHNDEQRNVARAKELRESVDSVRRKVPTDTFIVINEGSSYVHEDTLGADKVMYTDVRGWHKSQGDNWLFLTGWISEKDRLDLVTVSKLSGRYQLLEKFDWNMEPLEVVLADVHPNEGLMNTRYFRFHRSMFEHVLTECYKINQEYAKSWHLPDIEHMMFRHKVFTAEQATKKKLNVGGICAADNLWRED